MQREDIQDETEGTLLCDIIPPGSLSFAFGVPLVQIGIQIDLLGAVHKRRPQFFLVLLTTPLSTYVHFWPIPLPYPKVDLHVLSTISVFRTYKQDIYVLYFKTHCLAHPNNGPARSNNCRQICSTFFTAHKIHSSKVDAAFRSLFLHFNNCQPEVVGDVVSGAAVDPEGVKIREKFGDSTC